MALKLGDTLPDFTADTTFGPIQFHGWATDSWSILFSHPSDFTPVCTTELATLAKLYPEFEKRGIQVIALSCDDVDSHVKWIEDILEYGNLPKLPYPIIADPDRIVATKLGMLDPDEKDKDGLPLTCRAVFIVDEWKKLRLSILYPATTGRNFREILRVVDSLMLTKEKKVATPVNWEPGQSCMVLPSVPEDQLKELFPQGVKTVPLPSGRNYIRQTKITTLKEEKNLNYN